MPHSNAQAIDTFISSNGKSAVATAERTAWGSTHRKIRTMYSSGGTLYSYGTHYPMATIIHDKHGEPAAWMVNSDSNSVTTNKHMSSVRAEARRSGLPVIHVSHKWIEKGPGWHSVKMLWDFLNGQAVVMDGEGDNWLVARPEYIRPVGRVVSGVARAWETLRA